MDNGFSAVYTSNAAMHTGFVQVGLKPDHRIGSYEYIGRIKNALAQEMPQITPFFSTGSLVDAVVSMGAPAPIDVQIVGANLEADNQVAQEIASKLRSSALNRRRVHAAGSRLSVVAHQCGSSARRKTWIDGAGSADERHHIADFEPDDRAQSVDRSRATETTIS